MPTSRSSVKTKKIAVKKAPADKKAKRPAPAPVVKAVPVPVKTVAPKAKPALKAKIIPPPAPKKIVEKPLKSPLGRAELNYFRDKLLEKRREILGDVGSMESEAFKSGSNLSNMPIHMADVGTDNFEQEFTLGLIESERKILREIQEALGRIEDGSYGICQGTNKAIPKVRLEAVPWAKYSLEYAKAVESGAIRHETSSTRDDDGGDDEEE